MRMRSEFNVNLTSGQPFAAIFASELNRAELLRIFVAIFANIRSLSTFASHSHSQEVWTGLYRRRIWSFLIWTLIGVCKLKLLGTVATSFSDPNFFPQTFANYISMQSFKNYATLLLDKKKHHTVTSKFRVFDASRQ